MIICISEYTEKQKIKAPLSNKTISLVRYLELFMNVYLYIYNRKTHQGQFYNDSYNRTCYSLIFISINMCEFSATSKTDIDGKLILSFDMVIIFKKGLIKKK